MKYSFPLILLLFYTLLSCGHDKKSFSETVISENTEVEFYTTAKLDSVMVSNVLTVPTLNYEHIENGYKFNLPFNYTMSYIPKFENVKDHYYIFNWTINENFSIDSKADDFKRFAVHNFITYLTNASYDEGEIYIVGSNNMSNLSTTDFFHSNVEFLYKDENSAIIKENQTVKAFYFEYLAATKEYLVYLSKTPFWNLQPEPTEEEKINQLLHQLRSLKNITKPIVKQNNNWDILSKQLSVLEKKFLQQVITETKASFSNNVEIDYYAPTTQGNREYFKVFKYNSEIEVIWKKLNRMNKGETITLDRDNKEFEGFYSAYFFYAENELIKKDKVSLIYKKKDSNFYCLVVKPEKSNVLIVKEFPDFTDMSLDYYNNEVEFYKNLFENYSDF